MMISGAVVAQDLPKERTDKYVVPNEELLLTQTREIGIEGRVLELDISNLPDIILTRLSNDYTDWKIDEAYEVVEEQDELFYKIILSKKDDYLIIKLDESGDNLRDQILADINY